MIPEESKSIQHCRATWKFLTDELITFFHFGHHWIADPLSVQSCSLEEHVTRFVESFVWFFPFLCEKEKKRKRKREREKTLFEKITKPKKILRTNCHIMIRKKKTAERNYSAFFFESSESHRVSNSLADSNSIFGLPRINLESISARTVFAGGTCDNNGRHTCFITSVDPSWEPDVDPSYETGKPRMVPYRIKWKRHHDTIFYGFDLNIFLRKI